MFETEKRFPDIVKQFTKPLEEKLLLAYSALDEVEQQVDEVENRVNDLEIANGGSKRPPENMDSENEEDDKEEYSSKSHDPTPLSNTNEQSQNINLQMTNEEFLSPKRSSNKKRKNLK